MEETVLREQLRTVDESLLFLLLILLLLLLQIHLLQLSPLRMNCRILQKNRQPWPVSEVLPSI